MESPKMDLSSLSSDSLHNTRDGHITNSEVITPDCHSPESVDTGFASDGTQLDTPSPLSEEKNILDSPLPNGRETALPSDEEKTVQVNNHEQKENKPTTSASLESKPEPINAADSEITEALNSSQNEETGTSSLSKDTESNNISEHEGTVMGGDNSETESQKTSASNNEKETEKTDDDKEEYVDILGNGLLKKKVLKPGAGRDSRPTNGEVITLKVEGHLDGGTQIDDGEITFTLNDGDVIVAFELAVALMEQGEKCELFTSSRYAFGELGREPDIPKDTNITYTLELLDVKPPVDVATLSCDERLKIGEQKRERGNYLFKRTDYSGAINSYSKAVKVLDDTDLNAGLDDASRAQLADCWSKCYNNMAACQLKIDALDAVIRSCEKVLAHQADNVKAIFRLGKAHGAKGEVDEAISYLKKAIKLDPESKMLHQEMLTLTRRKTKETESERILYQRMFGVKPDGSQSKEDEKKKNSSSVMKWTLLLGAMTAAMVSVGLTWYRNS